MKVKELIEKLQTFDENSDVIVGERNDLNTPTYAMLDYAISLPTEQVKLDMLNTMGNIDERILDSSDSTDVVYLGSKFEFQIAKIKE